MKKLFLIITCFLTLTVLSVFAEGTVIQGGVSLSDQIPKGFFGTWHIASIQTFTSNPMLFTGAGTDFWNLSKVGDVITLSNPVSGATASVTIEEVNGNQIKFVRTSENQSEKVIETPTLILDGENFYGTDKIVIEKYKFGELVGTDTVEYRIKAKKISGNSAGEFFQSKR